MSTFDRASFWFHRNWLEPRHFTFSFSNFSRSKLCFWLFSFGAFQPQNFPKQNENVDWDRRRANCVQQIFSLGPERSLVVAFFLSFTQTTIGSTTKCLRLWASSHRRRGESDSRKTHFLDDVRRRGKSLEFSRVHTQHGSSALSYELGFWENSQLKNVNKKNQSDDVNKR